ncbi:MAG: DPP IV N-terminal domain-containing protein [Planctomycetota bacterium]
MIALPSLLLLAAPQSAQEATPSLTLEQTHRGSGEDTVSLAPDMPTVSWSDDGTLVRVRERGGDRATRWIDPRTGQEVAAPEGTEEEVTEEERAESDAPALRHRLEESGEVRLLRRAPDGARAAFVRGNDLYVADSETAALTRITSNGGPDQFNGILDWVYQEEIYGRGDFLGHAWSPGSSHVLYLSLDESPVYEFTVVDHIEDGHFRVRPEITNYPKVGDPNPIPAVGVADAATGETTWVDLSRYDGQEILVVRFSWTPAGDRALVTIQDRVQSWAELLTVDPATGASEVLIREESDAWTERPEDPEWLPDGSFVWQSHRTGPMHLYRYAADGTLVGSITRGAWNVQRVERIEAPRGADDPAGASPGHVWFRATKDGDINSNLYRSDLDGGGFVRLTQGEGTHDVRWNGDRTMFIDRYSSLTNPGTVQVSDADGNVLATVVERAGLPAADETALGRWELHKVPVRDGMVLDAAVLKPADFDPERSYAVWVSTYSGPAAPSVRNRWNRSAFFQFLAQQGVIVLQANVRSSTNRGPAATAALYRRVGLGEVQDMCDVVDWLTAEPWADASRVGITGYSFGGTMTANCLLRTEKFALGIAGGGVYDWRMYDTIYTERYMRTPADNLEGYEATSCLAQAANLSGFLHMHHGVMDDNVHVQNMFQMAHALMEAGRTNWSMMTYPQTRHGIRDRELSWHARQLEWSLIEEHLLGS